MEHFEYYYFNNYLLFIHSSPIKTPPPPPPPSSDWCRTQTIIIPKPTTRVGKFLRESPDVHVWQMLARPASCWRLRPRGFMAPLVTLLSCYWAVNPADGSCLCVLIRTVTLNLGIDTWGDAERREAAIYRPSIMTFIDDVTTGARAFETHNTHTHTHTHTVCWDIESICLSLVHTNTHTHIHTNQRLSILNST